MDVFVYLFAAFLVASLLWFVTRKNNKPKAAVAPQVQQQNRDAPPRVRRRFGRDRIQREIARYHENEQQEQLQQVQHSDDDQEKESSSDSEEKTKASKKIGTKKKKKLQEKEEKKKLREAEMREREEKKQEEEKKEQARIKEEEILQKEEEKKAAELQRQKEEEEKRELEEYMKLKEEFELEEEGEERGSEDEESQNLLEEFLEYIKESKVIFLEDLASHFGLRTQEAIDRVQDLLNEGILTGVIDDRGKFIYITMEELEAVADFVKRKGRVSIRELARVSNSLININPERESTMAK